MAIRFRVRTRIAIPIVVCCLTIMAGPLHLFPSAHATTQDSLHVSGSTLQTSSGAVVTLIGLNYGDFPGNSPTFSTGNPTQDAKNIRAEGFNSVNLVTEWGALMIGPGQFNSTYENVFTSRVNALTAQHLYVIVKLHADYDQGDHLNYLKTNLLNNLGSTNICPGNSDFYTGMKGAFYITNAPSLLTTVFQEISRLTSTNQYVVGYDVLNEPTICDSTSHSTVRSSWHSDMNTLASSLNGYGDSRILFVEEAPFYDHLGTYDTRTNTGQLTYTANNINFANYVASEHFYQGEQGPPWKACFSSQTVIQGYLNSTSQGNSGSCTGSIHDSVTNVLLAKKTFPNTAFSIGEFSYINGNSPNDINEQFIQSSAAVFQNNGLVGWFYWSSSTSGTWINDEALGAQEQFLRDWSNMVNSGTVGFIDYSSVNRWYGNTCDNFSTTPYSCYWALSPSGHGATVNIVDLGIVSARYGKTTTFAVGQAALTIDPIWRDTTSLLDSTTVAWVNYYFSYPGH